MVRKSLSACSASLYMNVFLSVDVLTIIIAVFAVYRLATDFAWEDGPMGVYAKGRGAVIARYGKGDWRSLGIVCPICWSFWLALPAVFVWGPLAWLGIAGAAAFLARLRPIATE